jgi:hypothetical protein
MKIYSNGIHEALERLSQGESFSVGLDGTYESIVWNSSTILKPTKQQVEEEIANVIAEYIANEYQRQRVSEYPRIEDQLDLLYHGGYDAWKASIDEIKNKYPKPTE